MITRRKFLIQVTAAGVVAASSPLAQASKLASESPAAVKRTPGVVQTVLGPIDASELGFTLPHEHIQVSSAGFLQSWPEYFGGREQLVNKAVEKLKEAKAEGVDTVVDVTPADIGRDVRLLEEVSRKSGVHIITSTGHWLVPSLSMQSRTAEELTRFFMLEIERGIDGTGIKPGVIKVATDQPGLNPFLENTLRAAARAGIASGLPIMAHTHSEGRIGEQQAAIFEEEGLSPDRVCLSHSDDIDDVEYLAGLAKRGYVLGMDHLTWGTELAVASGIMGSLPWQKRVENIKALIDAGYVEKLFISNDWYFDISMTPTGFMAGKEQTNPDGILFSSRKVIPHLKELGVTDQQIKTITVENPKRFFGGL